MTVTYLIALKKNKTLNKTDYFYRHTLTSGKTVFLDNDGIFFKEKLWPQEEDIAKNLFPQRKVYAIRASVPLEYRLVDNGIIQNYYLCEKEQCKWFLDFLKKHTQEDGDVFFLQICLGHPINYSKIKFKCINLNNIKLPEDNFAFEDSVIHQFVNN